LAPADRRMEFHLSEGQDNELMIRIGR
jgi:hypothetical protein